MRPPNTGPAAEPPAQESGVASSGQGLTSLAGRLGSRAVVNTTVVLIARVISRLVALVMVIVLARHLGAADYGRYTTLVAYSAIVSVIADFGLDPLYTREVARHPDLQPSFLGTVFLGKLPLAAVAVAVFGVALASAGLGNLLLPAAALLVLATYSTLLRNTFFAVGRVEFEAIAVICETMIQAAAIFGGAKLGFGVGFFVFGYAASFGFTTVYCLVVIKLFGLGGIRPRFDRRLFRSWLKLAFPFALASFLTNVYWKADVPMLQHFQPYAEVGWYQFAYKPFESLQFMPLAVQTVIYPLLAVYHQQEPDRVEATYARFFKILLLLGWPLTVGTFVLVHPIGRVFRLFPESEPSLRILAVAIVFLFINSAFIAMLGAMDRQDLFAWATGIAVLVNLGLNLALIPRFGYLAASATTVVTEAALSVVGWWFVRRRYRLAWAREGWRPVLAGVVMGAALIPVSRYPIYICAPIGAIVYLTAVFVLRAVDREEVQLLRRGFRPRALP
jgi:O-antigen/teichoic acid export membrane protein